MPELPEVRVVVKNLNENILNKKIKYIEVVKEKLFKEKPINEFRKSLENATIKSIENKGKHIVFIFDNDYVLISHLRMEGKYKYYSNKTENHKHLMTKFIFTDDTELHYLDSRMFGTFHLRTIQNYDSILPLSKLGNEPQDVDLDELFKKLQKSTTSIKTKLLDQTYVLGLGNIYVDEALFASKVHPLSSSNKIPKNKLKEILDNSFKIMEKSYLHGGSTIHTYESFNNKSGNYQDYLLIHNDKIKTCLVCKNETSKIKVNGRGTYLCNKCQVVY